MTEVELTLLVNGARRHLAVRPGTLLVDLLRDSLGLTGTHVGCDTAQCGACTVVIDGEAVKSCNLLAVQADGAAVTTIEGLAPDGTDLHPLQRAFSRHHALQCGYCTPGMLMRARALLDEGVPADEDRIAEAISGNLCRCTGYHGIVRAIREVLADPRADAR